VRKKLLTDSDYQTLTLWAKAWSRWWCLILEGMTRQFVLLFLIGVFLLTPFSAFAANVNFFGPIIPDGTNGQPDCRCTAESTGFAVDSAPDWSCVLATIQNAVAFGVTFILIIITFAIAYAGIMIMAQPNNVEHRNKAKSAVTNALLGLVIVLTAWLIVDFVMKAFYNQTKGEEVLGSPKALPWNSIFSDDMSDASVCFKPQGTVGTPTPQNPGNGTSGNTGGNAPTNPSNTPATTPLANPNNGTATTKPGNPSGFKATPSATSITLIWNTPSDASIDWYVLESARAGGTYQLERTILPPQNTYTDTGLTTGERYFYRLFAWNEAGFSPSSNVEATAQNSTAGGTTGGSSLSNSCTASDGNAGSGPDEGKLKSSLKCENCVALVADCKTSASCKLRSSAAGEVNKLWNSDVFSGNWRVTEAFPPTLCSHSNSCHYTGTCIDAGFTSGTSYTLENVTDFMDAAKAAGLRPVFETTDCSLRTSVRNAGYSAFCTSDTGYSKMTATHFSLYEN